ERIIIPAEGADGKPISSITLHSTIAKAAVIQAPASLSSGNDAIVDVRGATGVVIDGFKVTGKTSGAFPMAGIYVEQNGSAAITGCWITGLQTNNQTGIGILVGNTPARLGNGSGTKGTATISRVTIDNYAKGGIVVVNGSSAAINSSTITGIGETT